MFSSIVSSFVLFICVLLAVAFFTLLERKILGLSQCRKGPNKVAFLGILQPFSDALKLFFKEMIFLSYSNKVLFFMGPIMSLFLMLTTWLLAPLSNYQLSIQYSFMFMLAMMGMSLYPLLISGWSSNSKYSLLGSLRGAAQTISYEVSLAILFMSVIWILMDNAISKMSEVKGFFFNFSVITPIFVIWLISCVAETNRTPFDFSEGESELVSGFNIEYSAYGFALIFMAEYGMILFFSAITASIFFGPFMSFMTVMIAMTISFWWVWIRSTFPRYRYDKLMSLAWKTFLPMALGILIFTISLN